MSKFKYNLFSINLKTIPILSYPEVSRYIQYDNKKFLFISCRVIEMHNNTVIRIVHFHHMKQVLRSLTQSWQLLCPTIQCTFEVHNTSKGNIEHSLLHETAACLIAGTTTSSWCHSFASIRQQCLKIDFSSKFPTIQ